MPLWYFWLTDDGYADHLHTCFVSVVLVHAVRYHEPVDAVLGEGSAVRFDVLGANRQEVVGVGPRLPRLHRPRAAQAVPNFRRPRIPHSVAVQPFPAREPGPGWRTLGSIRSLEVAKLRLPAARLVPCGPDTARCSKTAATLRALIPLEIRRACAIQRGVTNALPVPFPANAVSRWGLRRASRAWSPANRSASRCECGPACRRRLGERGAPGRTPSGGSHA